MIVTITITIIMIFSIADAGAKYAAEIHINLEDIKVRKQIICRRSAPSLPWQRHYHMYRNLSYVLRMILMMLDFYMN